MTFSILASDPETGAIGGAAATGSLCVGGWVLRGDMRAGMSASQGAAPSTFWGEDALQAMRAGKPAPEALRAVTQADGGRDWRQLSVLDLGGGVAAFTGSRNEPEKGSVEFPGGIAAGNLLANARVLDAMAGEFRAAGGPFAERLLAALAAAEAAGSDSRGLLSAALLVLRPDAAPLTLRIDRSDAPLAELRSLYETATSGEYYEWSRQVPCLEDPERVLD